MKDKLKKIVKPLYFKVAPFIRRLPIYMVRLLNSLPIQLFDYDERSLQLPIPYSGSIRDWAQDVVARKVSSGAVEYLKIDENLEFIRKSKPNTIEEALHPQFLEEKVAHPNESFVVTLPKGRVWGEYGAIITEDNSLLEDISVYRMKATIGQHRFYKDWHLCKPQKVDGKAAVLATDSTGLYYHWMVDFVLRYALLLRAGFTQDSFDAIIIGGYAKLFQAETLTILGIKEEKLIQTSQHPYVQANYLVVPSYPTMGGQFRPWHIEFLRNTFLPHVPVGSENRTAKKRLYISRGDATYRRVLNEPQVIAFLEDYGFEPVQLGTLSVVEQVELMVSAEMIVAPHGGGLTNIVFCQAGTQIIEVFSPELVGLYFWKLADLCHLDYHYIVGDRIRSATHDQSWNPLADIQVPIAKLKQTLERL